MNKSSSPTIGHVTPASGRIVISSEAADRCLPVLSPRMEQRLAEAERRIRILEDRCVTLTEILAKMRKNGAGSNPRIGGKRR